MEKLEAALRYGADAAYLGGRQFGLRAFGGNFTQDEIAAAVRLAHGMGKKIYVTVNVFPHNEDLVSLPDYLRFLKEAGADAVLVADLGVFMCAREATPGLPIHVSTQANNVNWRTVRAWQELGATRVVPVRGEMPQLSASIRERTLERSETGERWSLTIAIWQKGCGVWGITAHARNTITSGSG